MKGRHVRGWKKKGVSPRGKPRRSLKIEAAKLEAKKKVMGVKPVAPPKPETESKPKVAVSKLKKLLKPPSVIPPKPSGSETKSEGTATKTSGVKTRGQSGGTSS